MINYIKSISPELKIIIAFALARLALHIIYINDYGYFRDELYYIACGEHLDFGYVDHPPFVAIIAKVSRMLFGDSLFAIRILSVTASSSLVLFAGLFAREFGGKKSAIVMACLLVFFTPVLLGTGSFLSMNSFDQMFWMIALYIFIRILRTGNSKYWIWFGIVIGIGFQTKISILFLCFGLFIGLLLTPNRSQLRNKHLWKGVLVAVIIALPNILWQLFHDWPTLEFIHNASTYKNAPLSPIEFIAGQIMNVNPFFSLFVPAGLWFFFFDKKGKVFCIFGWMFISLLLLFIATSSKTYYMAPIYPLILPAGAIVIIRVGGKFSPAILVLIILMGITSLPFALPVLPVDQFIRYSRFIGVTPESGERTKVGELPQLYADMFGWKEMTQTVAGVYHSLSAEEKKFCGIYTQNYGEAGAIDFFGKQFGLPDAYSGHNNYWIWGSKTITDMNVLIIVGGNPDDHRQVYDNVGKAAVFSHPYVMPYENDLIIYICRGLKKPLNEVWLTTKFFI